MSCEISTLHSHTNSNWFFDSEIEWKSQSTQSEEHPTNNKDKTEKNLVDQDGVMDRCPLCFMIFPFSMSVSNRNQHINEHYWDNFSTTRVQLVLHVHARIGNDTCKGSKRLVHGLGIRDGQKRRTLTHRDVSNPHVWKTLSIRVSYRSRSKLFQLSASTGLSCSFFRHIPPAHRLPNPANLLEWISL